MIKMKGKLPKDVVKETKYISIHDCLMRYENMRVWSYGGEYSEEFADMRSLISCGVSATHYYFMEYLYEILSKYFNLELQRGGRLHDFFDDFDRNDFTREDMVNIIVEMRELRDKLLDGVEDDERYPKVIQRGYIRKRTEVRDLEVAADFYERMADRFEALLELGPNDTRFCFMGP